jgi:TonB family protein
MRALLLPLVLAMVVPPALPAQAHPERLVNDAYALVRAGHLDSADALLSPVLDSSFHRKPDMRAVALVLHGLIQFLHGSDSTAALAFHDALAIRIDLNGDWMYQVDSSLGRVWRRERRRAICGVPEPEAVDFLVSDTTGLEAGTPFQKPGVLSGPTLRYPEVLRRAGVQGRVVVAAVVDTAGRAEEGSIKILETPHPDFSREARRYVEQARFRPARIRDRPVRVCVQVPVDFRIRY